MIPVQRRLIENGWIDYFQEHYTAHWQSFTEDLAIKVRRTLKNVQCSYLAPFVRATFNCRQSIALALLLLNITGGGGSKRCLHCWMKWKHGWTGKGWPQWHVSLYKSTLCQREYRWRDVFVVQCVVGITYSVAPAAQQVIRQGVLWLQLYGFIQMILGGQTERKTGRWFFHIESWNSCYFCCLLFWPDLSCFTNPQVFHKHLSHAIL